MHLFCFLPLFYSSKDKFNNKSAFVLKDNLKLRLSALNFSSFFFALPSLCCLIKEMKDTKSNIRIQLKTKTEEKQSRRRRVEKKEQ